MISSSGVRECAVESLSRSFYFMRNKRGMENEKNGSSRESRRKVDPQTSENSFGEIEAKCRFSEDWFTNFEDRLKLNRAFRLILFSLQARWEIWRLKQKKIRLRWRICTFSTDRFNPEFQSFSAGLFVARKRRGSTSRSLITLHPKHISFGRSDRHAISEFVSAGANCQTRDNKTRKREDWCVTDTAAQTVKSDDDSAIYADENLRTDRWTRASSHHQCAC